MWVGHDAVRYSPKSGQRPTLESAGLPRLKLAVTTNVPWSESFAELLDRALVRSQVKVIEHRHLRPRQSQFADFHARVRHQIADFDGLSQAQHTGAGSKLLWSTIKPSSQARADQSTVV